MDRPFVSVIIPHHTGRLIDRCLASVKQSEGMEYEILVVTSDVSYFGEEGIRLYFLDKGPAEKRNFATKRSQGEVIAYLDDDTEVSPFCLYELTRFLEEHPKVGMVFGKILKMEEGRRDEFDDCGSWLTWTGFLWSRAGNRQRDRGQFDTPQRCLASKSATCAIRRSTFTSVGGFDQDYYVLGEDSDIAWRVWLSGLEVWYVPSAKSFHAFGCESIKPKQNYYSIERTMTYGCRNYLRLLTTNLGGARLLAILPFHIAAWMASSAGFLVRGDGRRAKAVVYGLWNFLATLPQTMTKRARVQATRTVSDRDLWPLISYTPPLTYYSKRLWRYWTTQLHG